jgi:hypothetical protein
MEERLLRQLMASMQCESCGQPYQAYNIDIIGHREGLWFLRVLCSACHTQCLMAAKIKGSDMPEVITDLTELELDEAGERVIEADDILEIHNFLKDFDGDFSRLFSQGQP